MKNILNWKIIAILILALVLGYMDVPNQYQTLPYTPQSVKDSKIHLGLDLQGGSQLDYKIDLRKVPEADREGIVEGVKEVINRRVNALGVSEPNIYVSQVADEQHIIVELAGVKDLEKAKETVGKTIQLEFKEQKETLDPQEKTAVQKQAQSILKEVQSKPAEFSIIGTEEMNAAVGKVEYKFVETATRKDFTDEKLADEVFKAPAGKIIPRLIEGKDGFVVTEGQFIPREGFFIIQVKEKKQQEKTEPVSAIIGASHILVAYKDAQSAGAEITRSRREAKKEATRILKEVEQGATSFSEFAKKYSDEPNTETTAGKLIQPVTDDGTYVEAFTTAALALQKDGDISDVVETEFGFHIIRADKVTPATTKTSFEEIVSYESIFLSTIPDAWQETALTGEHFVRAEVQFDQLLQPLVAISFNDEGGKLFEELTQKNVGKPLAIFVGGSLISSPRVNEAISGGQAVITGSFTPEEAQNLARDLNTGAIPAPVVLTGQYTIGASLGQTALQMSLNAGLIGLLLVIIFMILYYRLPGLIATVALGMYAVILLFFLKAALYLPLALGISTVIFIVLIVKILKSQESGGEKLISGILAVFILFFLSFLLSSPVVLTLAGVAGVILSIGMAVDANILIFERTKEELKLGRPIRDAVEIGFDRAWSSIRDSNFSSLITCAILFYFGTSIIRGFAFNLAAGILISMFTAITITRAFLLGIVQTRLGQQTWLFGVSEKEKHESKDKKPLRIIENTRVWFGFSGVLIVISIISLFVNGLQFSIDFRGGTLLDITFEKSVTVDEIRGVLYDISEPDSAVSASAAPAGASGPAIEAVASDVPSSKNYGNAVIVASGENRWIVRTEHMDNETHDDLLGRLEAKFGTVHEDRFTTIGPTLGTTLKQRAAVALAVAFLAIIVYIAFAFRKVPKGVSAWRFGITAFAALLHDATITLGAFSLFKWEVDALFITALLTIIGFSVHDTIVVFDRIRENLKRKTADESLTVIANKSMTQTMARSINTSFSTLLTLLALLFFGSPTIFYFTLALVIGIVIGTYSSIFSATPLLVWWQNRKNS
ncbi:MAG: Protein-export membrane protein SecD [Candidatus Peregrinibacteria bacterium GW2011_GWA2_47_7]|nr:MAG: Protein-export membrane protein SecD [Candidatus Peregrinibacteria bacterium GW2011_GWA2_47_7]